MIGVFRFLAVAVVGTGLVLGATNLPEPLNLAQPVRDPAATAATTEPATQSQAICPGPEALGVAGLKNPPAQAVSVMAVSAPAEALPPGAIARQGRGSLTITGLPAGGTSAAPVTVRGRPTSGQISTARSALVVGDGALAPGTLATQRSWVKGGDNRALVTAACMPASASSWLIAGGGEPGRRERVVLINPRPNPVTVDLVVFGAKGPVLSPNGRGLVVGPYSRTVMLLDAIAGSESSPVVHVMAQGGGVAAFLSDSWLDGVVPRGGDDTAPVSAPAREQVIAGVTIDGRATLRIAVPGDGQAVVQSRVLTATGPRPLPAGGVTRLAAHSTTDIDLGSLPPGAYAVQVRADVPVVAAAMVDRRRTAGGPSDLAWSGATAPIRHLAGMALRGPRGTVTDSAAASAPGDALNGKGLSLRLDLAATNDSGSVRVTTVGPGGRTSSKEVVIAADSVATLALGDATSVWVTPRTGVVRAAVVTSVTDAAGVLLSLTPLADLALTTTHPPIRELLD